MTFEWQSFLVLAQRLARDVNEEASLRSAISRAYYAAFHTARRHVSAAHPEIALRRHGAEHDEVWRCLMNGSGWERTVGNHGDRLRQARAKADYRLMGLSLPRDAQRALEQAATIVRVLREMSPLQ